MQMGKTAHGALGKKGISESGKGRLEKVGWFRKLQKTALKQGAYGVDGGVLVVKIRLKMKLHSNKLSYYFKVFKKNIPEFLS
ncbi:hypothetical protein [Desulfomicrobium baculatum]|uniref:hypothetical protein n=1 Tax=Desulfomicrobium baculatum TaxID=899 RepID=UPI0002EF521E|nr:hypothetical protein [Desulfomicrobium baculatum]